ncbi:MAG: sialidase family protein [Verrucomicrobiaceae bacterium]
MILRRLFASSLLIAASLQAEDITWQLHYDAKALPEGPWSIVGTPNAKLEADGLRIEDDGAGFGHFRAGWKAGEDEEVVVEAEVKVLSTTGAVKGKTTSSVWPWRDGGPVVMQVSDGHHQEGLVLFPNQVTNFTDRFIPQDTTNRFHTYRLVIRGTDMQMFVDGERKVVGQVAFWKPAESKEPFILFGSTAKTATGNAIWKSVKLGTRKGTTPLPKPQLKVTVSEPWIIPERKGVPETRPYLYDMGKGLLLMSVAQGPDAFYEPYGLYKSTDAAKTWSPIVGIDQKPETPLPCLRRPDGSIAAMSRWTWSQPDGSVLGKTWRLNADATSFTMEDNRINLPPQYANEAKSDQTICERHIWNDADGGMTMVVWTRKATKRPDGRNQTERWSHLMRSTDGGKTWNHFSVVGPGGEPAVCRLSDTEQIAVIRGDRNSCMKQMFSHDAGKTWTPAVEMEEGRVLPDLVMMSNGVLACSYGRPASCLMFSLDKGKTWTSHHVISDRVRFNYTSIREISPGRLLYIHDAPKMTCVYVDVEMMRDP